MYKSIEEAMEYSIKAVIAQGCQSRDINGCLLRDENGNKCAVGHLIKDKDYSREIENKSIMQTLQEFVKFDFELSHLDIVSLSKLQVSHDHYDLYSNKKSFVEDFKSEIMWYIGNKDLPESLIPLVDG